MSALVLLVAAILISLVLSLALMGIFYVIRSKRSARNRRQDAAPSLKPEFTIDDDISNGRELNKVPAISYAPNDQTPVDFHYVNEHVCVDPMHVDQSLGRMNCCHCLDDCATIDCQCVQLNSLGPHYDEEGRLSAKYLTESVGAIRECNIACKCNRKLCKNMVIQAGCRLQMVLFKTKSRGWGVRTAELVPRGTFIGIYSGELISDTSSAARSDDTYLFNLSNTAPKAPDRPRAEEYVVPEQESPARADCMESADDGCEQVTIRRDWGEPCGEPAQAGEVADKRAEPRTPETFICDAKYFGNFTRFINHSCEPNVIGIRTFTAHQDDRFPYISFFANRDIQAGEEVTLNYGDYYWLVKCRRDRVYCLCKASCCRFNKKTFKQTYKKHKEQVKQSGIPQ